MGKVLYIKTLHSRDTIYITHKIRECVDTEGYTVKFFSFTSSRIN
jgi:hypothetical protein